MARDVAAPNVKPVPPICNLTMKSLQLLQLVRCRKARVAGALVLAMTAAAFSGWAQVKPKHRPDMPNFDTRHSAQKQALSLDQQVGRAKLAVQLPSAVVDFDPLLQTPQFVRSTDGFLTGPNGQGRGMSAKAAQAAPVGSQTVVRAFLNEHSGLFGHDSSVLDDARVKREYADKDTGLQTTIWEQQLDGIPVFQASLIAHVTKKNELVSLSSLFVPAPAAAADAGTPNRTEIQQKPALSVIDGIVAASRNLGFELAPGSVTEAQGTELESGYRLFKTPDPAFARLVWLPMNRASMRLAWEVMVENPKTKERFRFVLDAQTGVTYLRQGMTWYISDASYSVFTSDSPSPFTPGLQTPGNFQPPYTNRVLMVGPALDTNASPMGWIDDGNNTTTGNNADAFLDRDFNQQADVARPVGNPNRVFDFPLDLATDPTNYIDASTVELFFWANWYHDRLWQFGFNEAAGNYQERNFGRGGFGNDSIICYVQSGADLGIANNSMFASAPDGFNGQCFMFIFTFPNPSRDGSLDQEVVLHELTHGTSSRLVGGGMALNNIQSGGMGEGWSDFYALCLLSETNDDVNAAYPSGGYASYLLGGFDQNYYYGIRHFPYCTDMTKNPFTFKDIDPNQIDPHSTVPRSPLYPFDSREADEVHHQGEVWCSMLWEVRANLVTKYGWAVGNRLALQLVTDGMKLTPPNPNFIQARDGILEADLVRTAGINSSEIWKGFAKRGLGASARSPNSDTTVGVVEAYDVIGLQVDHTFVLGGNGNGTIDYDECNDLYIALLNGGTVGATNVEVSLTTTTPKAYVMQRVSAYPDIAPGGLATNLVPFKISTGPGFVCGTPIQLKVVIKSDQGSQGADLALQTGAPGIPIRWNNFFPIAIPDNSTLGTNTFLFVTNIAGVLQNVTVSVYTIHPFDSDLTFKLIGPDGTIVVLSDRNGGGGQNYGLSCFPDTSRTTFDDNATNRIVNGRPPFLGSYKPEQPLAAFAGKSGTNVNGLWQLQVIDNSALDVGSLQCWSLSLQPAACTPGGGQCPGVDLAIDMTANPDPAVVSSNLVYTIVVTNNGPGTARGTVVSQNLPAGAEFITAATSQGAVSEAGGVVTATLGNLGADESATIQVTVVPRVAGIAFSSASVASTEPELNPLNNSIGIRTIVAPPSSDLAVGLTDAPDPTIVGAPLTYTLSVTNKGPSSANAVIVTNILPASVRVTSAYSSDGSVDVAGNVVTFRVFQVLSRNGYATATIETIPQAFGNLTATATARAIQPDPFLANNTAVASTFVGQASDLAITMTARPDPVVLGSNVTFTITATNLGPNSATNVTVTQGLPVGVSVASVSVSQGTYSQSGSTMVANLGTLVVGSSATLRVVVTTPRVGTLTSTATITSAQTDPVPGNNTAVASAQVAPPFVSIAAAGTTLTAENFYPPNGSIEPGETVTIQFRLQNSGNVANTNLVATLLPTGGVVSPSAPQTYGILRPIGVPGGTPVSRPFSFTAGSAPGGVITATLVVQDGTINLPPVSFTFALPQVLRFANTNPIVIPTSGSADPYPSEITVTGLTGQVGRVTASLTQFSHDFPHDVSVLLVGPSTVKTLLLSHAGDRASSYNVDLTFSDTADAQLPAAGGLPSGTWKPSVYAPEAVFPSPAPAAPYATLLSDFNGLAGNGKWSLYVLDDSIGDGGVIAGGWGLELMAVTPVNQLADVGVTVAATPDPVLVGEILTYTWTVTNAGPATATGVSFSNALPPFLTFINGSVSQGNWITNDNVLLANFGSLAPGASAVLSVQVQPQVSSPDSVTGTAFVSAFESDLHTGDNRAIAVTGIKVPTVGLSMAMNAAPNPVIVGSNLLYTVTVTNNGPDSALRVVLKDALPTGVDYVTATASQGSVSLNNGVVTAALNDLIAGQIAELQVTVIPRVAGPVTNVVSVETASSDSLAGRTVSAVVTVNEPAARIFASGTNLIAEDLSPANGTVDPGETVTVLLALANDGVLDTVDLNATLLASGGVTQPGAPANYGVVRRGAAPVWRSFTFKADPAATRAVVATLQLADSGKPVGTVDFMFQLPSVTSVSSASSISIPERGTALPYPSALNIGGLTGVIGNVTVTLNQLNHSFPSDVTVLLASPGAPDVVLMSHNGGSYAVTNVTLTFDDSAAASLPVSSRMTTGTFKPSRAADVVLPPPAPLAPYGSALSVLKGLNPNGTWALYVLDDSTGDGGAIAGGWTLNITTLIPVNPSADLALKALGVPGAVLFGAPITYTFSVTNTGPESASNVLLTDQMPTGVTIVSNSVSQGTTRVDGQQFVFYLGAIPAGGSATARLTVLPTVAGSVLNKASLSGGFTDFNSGDNSVETTTVVINVLPPTLSANYSGGLLHLTGVGQPFTQYTIEASVGLSSWSAVSTNTAGADGTFHYTDSDTAQFGTRFYRAVRQLP